MAFLPYSYDGGQMPPAEYHKLSAGSGGADIAIGLCMALSGGKVSLSTSPGYICLRTEKSVADSTVIPVMHITGDVVFEAPLSAASASLTVGSKVDVAADGLTIANTTTVKNIQIISMDGTAAGDLCRCRFIA